MQDMWREVRGRQALRNELSGLLRLQRHDTCALHRVPNIEAKDLLPWQAE